jgi:hypothetical protein
MIKEYSKSNLDGANPYRRGYSLCPQISVVLYKNELNDGVYIS